MEKDLVHFIRTCKLFSSLDEKDVLKIIPLFTQIHLAHEKILFRQGDLSDNIYILIHGKLSALLTTGDRKTKLVGHIEAGQTVGELGALSKEPRTLTIKALRNSDLYQMSGKDFIEICSLYPSIMFATLHPIIARSQDILHMLTLKNERKHLSIIPAHKNLPIEPFIKKFSYHTEEYSSLILISDYDPKYRSLSPKELHQQIKKIELKRKPTQQIIFVFESFDTLLAQTCIKETDVLLIIGISGFKPEIDPNILNYIHSTDSHFKSNPELILLHPKNTVLPVGTMEWLDQTQFAMHYHLRINKTRHYQRLLRFIRNKAVGLVLGGGGTRGFAHIGVIKALREQRVPIDFIGGTSAGAIVGGCYAMNESYEDAYLKLKLILETAAGSVAWRNLTWPIISLFNANSYTSAQKEVFKNTQIEDLWVPYFCVSSNMATFNEDIHRSGPLWQKVRASTSVPGIVPPMIIDSELHLDGGLLNNLPVDIMKQFLGEKSKIIAVELTSSLHDYHKYQFPPILTFKEAILIKLGFYKNDYHFPGFLDTFLRGLLIGSSAKTKSNALAATLLVDLNLNKFKLLNSNIIQCNKMLEIGYAETLLRIKKTKKEKNT